MPKIITKKFNVDMASGRINEVATLMVNTMEEIDSMEESRKRRNDLAKAEIELATEKVSRFRKNIETRKEEMDLEVEVVIDYPRNSLQYVSTRRQGPFEVGELVDERAMTSEEREAAAQQTIPGTDN